MSRTIRIHDGKIVHEESPYRGAPATDPVVVS